MKINREFDRCRRRGDKSIRVVPGIIPESESDTHSRGITGERWKGREGRGREGTRGVVEETRRVDSFERALASTLVVFLHFHAQGAARTHTHGNHDAHVCMYVHTFVPSFVRAAWETENCPLTSSGDKLFDSREFDVPAERNTARIGYITVSLYSSVLLPRFPPSPSL